MRENVKKCKKCCKNYICKQCEHCQSLYGKIYRKKNKKLLRVKGIKYRADNIEQAREYDKVWKRKHRKKYPKIHKAVLRKSYKKNRALRLQDKKDKLLKLKLEAYKAYGGAKCVCCGEKHIEFLSLDHINNDGAKHRRKITNSKGVRGGSSYQMYAWLKKNKYPKGLIQILCMNCNMAKYIYGKCPHNKS